MTPITDISRYLKSKLSTETVIITSSAEIRLGCMTRSYFTGLTDDGEQVAIYASSRSLLFNCLSRKRIAHRPRLTLTGCSDRAKGFQPRFPITFPLRVIYCSDAEFADADRKLAFERARGTFAVGARMDAILSGGDELQALIAESTAA